MTGENLIELLERAANRVPVNPAPVAAMAVRAVRARRRRVAALAVVSAVASVAGVGTAVAFWPASGSSDEPPLVASPEHDLLPPGLRLVGLASAAIAVPQEWGANVNVCGTPTEDTVIIDLGFVPLCGAPRPAGVESVEVGLGEGSPWFDFTADETVEIDDVPAQRQATACQPEPINNIATVCAGTVHIPSMNVYFRAESSTSAEEVDHILEQIRILPDRAGVPGYKEAWLPNEPQEGERIYLDMLRDAGLAAEVRTVNARPVGSVVGVSPEPGTMLRRGDVVSVTVARKNPAG